MLENTSTPAKSVLFFITRLFMLVFMILLPAFVFYVVGVYLISLFNGYNFMATFNWLNSYKDNQEALHSLKFLQVFSTIGSMIIPAWFFPQVIGQDSATFVQTSRPFNRIYIVLGILAMLVSIPLVSWLIEWNSQIQLPAELERTMKEAQQAAEELTKAFTASSTPGGLLVNIAVIALIPAIAEELLFRGALQQFIYFCFRNRHSAVISTAIIFSAVHGEFYGFFPRMILGIILGYLFAYSGSLWPSVVAHFTNNLLTLLAFHFHWNESNYAILKDDYRFPVYIVILSTLLVAALIYFMFLKRSKTIIFNDSEQLG